jgi:hypothetical protein
MRETVGGCRCQAWSNGIGGGARVGCYQSRPCPQRGGHPDCPQRPEVWIGREHTAREPVQLAVVRLGLARQQPAAERNVNGLAGGPVAYRISQARHTVGEPG